jgi:hypothetical protein
MWSKIPPVATCVICDECKGKVTMGSLFDELMSCDRTRNTEPRNMAKVWFILEDGDT